DLVDSAINMVRTEREDEVYDQAEQRAEERLLDLLLPPPPPAQTAGTARTAGTAGTAGPPHPAPQVFVVGSGGQARPESAEDADAERRKRSREKLREMLRKGELDEREVEVEV